MQCSVCTIFTVQTGLFYYNCSLFIMKKAVVIVAGGLLGGLVGSIIGQKLLNKHFVKAGLVSVNN